MPWALLARLLDVHHTSIAVPAAPAATALQVLGLASPEGPRIRTLGSLLAHAATAGITITIPVPAPPAATTTHATSRDTPEPAT